MSLQYLGLSEINGPLVFLDNVENASYEEMVEINCHGGVYITSRVLEVCIKNGARMAERGEFSKRAFLNGRIDLSQAEAISDIITAKIVMQQI